MRLVDGFRTRRGATAARALLDESGYAYLQQTYAAPDVERVLPTFASFATDGYAQCSPVFSVIGARLNLFSEATFKFRDRRTKRLFGSAELAILENPWPNGTTGELLARMEQDVSLAGNAFVWRPTRDRLQRLRPDLVDIVRVEGDGVIEVAGYVYWKCGRGAGKLDDAVMLTVDEVAHWSPIPDPLATFRGMSWLTPVVREINLDKQMGGFQANYFANNATPNAIIKYQGRVSKEDHDRITKRWAARHGGPDGIKTAILDEGADFQVIGSDFDDMTFNEGRAAVENRIASAGGVPPMLVGFQAGLDASTLANYSAAIRHFADNTMRPNWRSACAALSKLVDVPAGAVLSYDTSDVSALRDGEKDRADTMQVLAAAASTLLTAGYTPESVTNALVADDLTLLEHSGLMSVQLQPPGSQPTKGES